MGFCARMSSSETVQGSTAEKTFCSRMRRAMSCVYCDPKSRITIDCVADCAGERVAAGVVTVQFGRDAGECKEYWNRCDDGGVLTAQREVRDVAKVPLQRIGCGAGGRSADG